MFSNEIFGMEIFGARLMDFGYGYLIVHQNLMRSASTKRLRLNDGRKQIFSQRIRKTFAVVCRLPQNMHLE